MGDFAEKIKRWNEVERKRVAARLQVWADGKEGLTKSCSCFGSEAVLKEVSFILDSCIPMEIWLINFLEQNEGGVSLLN